MSFFTVITTNVRAKRAAVMLYALVLFSLAVFGNYTFTAEHRRDLMLLTVGIGLIALLLVAQISRGRLDQRLAWVSMWLVLANVAILALYIAAFWPQLRDLTR